MTTTNDWIKMSERKPTEADLPVWFWPDDWAGPGCPPLITFLQATNTGRWCKADIPAPPKEQTQRERDEAAFEAWNYRGDGFLGCWHAALAWERAEIAKLLANPPTKAEPTASFLAALTARLRP